MKKFYMNGILLLFLSLFTGISGAGANEKPIANPYSSLFNKAYQSYPNIPKGVLEAVSFVNTRFSHIDHPANEQGSCIGIPRAYGVMGLTLDGKGYFRNNLLYISSLAEIPSADIINDPEQNILAFAKAYSKLLVEKNITSTDPADHIEVLVELSELPNDNLLNNFALNSFLYEVYKFLANIEYQQYYGFPNDHIDLIKIFGAENYDVLSASIITASYEKIQAGNGAVYRSINSVSSTNSSDYAPALWNPAGSCNYSSRNGTAVSAVTIHDVEGTYAGCISWFQNCNASVSAHYVLRSSDGQITQMVLESNKAWHVGSENPYTIGLEHEGYRNQTGWYTTAMYNSSAALVRDICNSGYGINPLRTYYGPSCNDICTLGGCTKIKGHQHYPNQTHNDPGPNWDWYLYYRLINNNPTITTLNTATGNVYDSGGQSGNYTDDERTLFLIAPPNASSVTLTFNSFDLETNWDYLFLYDGSTTSAPLIGIYTGTNGPATVTSTGGNLLLEFRSDCATTAPGWAASWTSTTPVTTQPDITPPTTSVAVPNTWVSTGFAASFTDDDDSTGVDKAYYQVIDYNGQDWRANSANGFFSDNFDLSTIHADWTQKTGTWSINTNVLQQSDETVSNTNIYASLKQNLSNRYLYNWAGRLDGTGTNRRAGFHFFCDQPDSSNRGNSYFVWFRLDDDKIQIYKVVNNSWGSTPVKDTVFNFTAGQWYDFKVVYDRITGLIRVYVDNQRSAEWVDSSPLANGDYISFRSGNCNYQVNNFKVYRSRYPAVTVSVGQATTNDIRYENINSTTPAGRVKSIVTDHAGNISSVDYQDINVDWSAPNNFDVADGDTASTDIDTTYNGTMLQGSWTPSSDPNSGISRYWYAIGTTPGGTDIVNWTDNWFYTESTADSLSLIHNTIYYYAVKAENGAGIQGAPLISDGQLYFDIATSLIHYKSEQVQVQAFPNPFSGNTAIHFNLIETSNISITLRDILGQEIQLVKDQQYVSGAHKFQINTSGMGLSKGIYTLTISSSKFSKTIKLAEN